MIQRVLVANRGEIARRVFATCRRLGIGTVAVYTEPDADSPHLAEADARVRLPDTGGYRDAASLIAAARATGADAIHPGYGFLSENPEFATAVADAGLVWIGPPAAAVAAMGSKIEAKKRMAAAGVPVLAELAPETITADQLPVLVKASAGGGGRGMRVVRELSALAGEVAAAQREAAAAFGDPTVFCERYLDTGHHVEVQIIADTHGTVWAVGERECSIQRRHQKIIEEAPSPLVQRTPGMRARLFQAARATAEVIGYTGVGTVEFMAAPDGSFYFLEMNTRLQVEHPVTEATTGLDLVELQLSIAEGAQLAEDPPPTRGHAVEARIYAEDPSHDWQPQAGTIQLFDIGSMATEFAGPAQPGIRLDSGVQAGSTVSIFYDPMLAKVICSAPTRCRAIAVLADTLQRSRIHGVRTNRDLLVRTLRHPAFLAGLTDTGFLTTHGLSALSAPLADAHTAELSALAAALAQAADNLRAATAFAAAPSGWRNVAVAFQTKTYRDSAGVEHRVRYRFSRAGLLAPDHPGVALVSAAPEGVVLCDNGVEQTFRVARYDAAVVVDSPSGAVELLAVPRFPSATSTVAAGSLLAPMPGSVVRVGARVGQPVTAGQPLVWLEAMKMEHTVASPADGVITELNVAPGQQVAVGTVLARVEGA